MLWQVAALVGVLWLAATLLNRAWQLARGFLGYVLAPTLGVGTIKFTDLGSWAVVTGASEGIGRAYALQLAKRGMNVVLMSRSQEKLEQLAEEIRNSYGREALVIPVDFSHGYEIYQEIGAQLQGLDVGVLVNNVGKQYEFYELFGEVGTKNLYDVTQVNCHAIVQMCRMVLPGMVRKKRGVVINVSSSASITSMPLLTVYSASKIFVNYISDGLRKEYGPHGIVVQTVLPGYVSTRMINFRSTDIMCVSPQFFVQCALATVGIMDETFGYFLHALQGFFMSTFLPSFLMNWLLEKRLSTLRENYRHTKIRAF